MLREKKTVLLGILGALLFILPGVLKAGEGKFLYQIEGPTTGEKHWEKQIIYTNLYDVEAKGVVTFYYGVWTNRAKEDKEKGLIKKDLGYDTVIIDANNSPLKSLTMVKQVKDAKLKEISDKVYQYTAKTDEIVIIRSTGADLPAWTKLNGKEVEKVGKWSANLVYVVEMKPGDVLDICSPGWKPGLFSFEYADNPTTVKTDPAKNSCVLCLHFDEGFGLFALDSSGNNNHGKLINGVKWTSGKFGGGLEFDGKTGYVVCPDAESLHLSSAVTMSAWFKANTDTKTMTIIMAKTYRNRIILNGKSIQGTFNVGNTYCKVDTTEQLYTPGKWTYVVVTQDGEDTRLYVDGKFVGQAKKQGGILEFGGPIYVSSERGSAFFFDGAIDEVKIYNYALSQEEIEKEYNKGITTDSDIMGKLVALKLNLNEQIMSLSEKLKWIQETEYEKLLNDREELKKDIEKEIKDFRFGYSNSEAFLFAKYLDLRKRWDSLNRKEGVLSQMLEEKVKEKRIGVEKRVTDFKKDITLLKEKELFYRPVETDLEKVEIYLNLSNLKTADSFKRIDYLTRGEKYLVQIQEKVDKIKKNKIKYEIKGDSDKLMVGVSWTPNPTPALDTLKALRIKYCGNSNSLGWRGITKSGDIDFSGSDKDLDFIDENELEMMIIFAYPQYFFSGFFKDQNKFQDECVDGTASSYKGPVVITASPLDIPLKWVEEEKRYLEAVVERYMKRKSILHWDVWGEAHPLPSFYASSPLVTDAYRNFLREKYKNINKLNEVWKTTYQEFNEIQANPFAENLWQRTEWCFFSHILMANYLAYMTDVIKKIDPFHPISPVLDMYAMYPGMSCLDPYLLAKSGGIYKEGGIDIYAARRDKFPYQAIATYVDTLRSVTDGGRIWIGEMGHWIQLGAPAHTNCTYPEEVREWTYTAFLHGAKFIAHFVWSPGDSVAGQGEEGDSFCLMHSDFTPYESAIRIGEIGCETRNYQELWACKPEREVAILYPRQSALMGESSPAEMAGLYAIISDCGFGIDPMDDDILKQRLSRYKILVIPPASYIADDVWEKIELFVQQGGVLITSPFTGIFNEWGSKREKSELRALLEKKNTIQFGKGWVYIVKEDIGREYRQIWVMTQCITEKMPIDFNRKENQSIRESLLSFLKDKVGLLPFAFSDKEGVEVSVISNGDSRYLVMINHREETVEPIITTSVPINQSVIYDIFSLKEASVRENNNKYEVKTILTSHEVLFFPI